VTAVPSLTPRLVCTDPRPYAHWRLHGRCNLRCPYCFYDKIWHVIDRDCALFPLDVWKRFWDGLYRDHGSFQISLTGGEPFMYRDLGPLLAHLAKRHTVDVCTNLTWNVADWAPRLDPAAIGIHAAFHPYAALIDDFVRKLSYMRDRGFAVMASFVGYPPAFERLAEYGAALEKAGLPWMCRPLTGWYQGKRYPDAYTPAEAGLVKSLQRIPTEVLSGLRFYSEELLVGLTEQGRTCLRIDADGTVRRWSRQKEVLGRVGEPLAA
jgi:organic radical activating enzyme